MAYRIPTVLLMSTLVAALSGCGGGAGSQDTAAGAAPGLISLDGSSTVFPISEAVAEEFQKTNPNTRVTVGISGTGGGFQKFCRAETDISDASRPISASEIETCGAAGVEYIELPIAYDGLAVVVNPKNTWAPSVTVEELNRLWSPDAQGKVMRWNQVRASWPDREIHLFGAGVDSGTFDYFTEAVVGKQGSSRGDFTSSEDDNVLVQGVAGDEFALGFVPLAYAEQNSERLKRVSIDDGDAENGAGPILPTVETVRDGTYQPLSRPLFLYIARRAADRPEVQAFVDAYFSSQGLIREVGYVELPSAIYDLAKQRFADRTVGTVFGNGAQVGLTLEALLAKEQ